MNKGTEERVSMVCVFIAATFVLFTFPYAMGRLIEGRIKFWATLILVCNSGLNSIIYFFRGKCEQYQDRLAKKNQLPSSSASTTPMTTAGTSSTPQNIRKDLSPNVTDRRKLSTNFYTISNTDT